jgi:hypothetical protein
MVETIPREALIEPSEVVTSKAPESHISTGDIVGPYQRLANSLDKLGQGLEDVATPLAEQAGYKAVTRDADGNIQVERAPIFGKAGDAYAHAVKMGALAAGEGDAKRQDIELREKYRDNPEGYQNAARAYKDATVKQYTAAAGPEVGIALGLAIDNTTTMTFRGLLNEKERLDLQRSESQMNAGLKDAFDDAMALSRQGPGGQQAEYALEAATGKYATLLAAKAENPRLAYSQEQRAFDLQQFQGELGGQRYLYHIDQTYKEKGAEDALEDAKDVLTNEAYKLKPAQRDHYYHQAVGEIKANEAGRTQDYQLANENFRDIKSRWAQGERIDPSEISAQIRSFEAIGGVKGAGGVAAVNAYFAHKDLHDDFGKRPLHDQNSELDTIRGAAAARDIYNEFRRLGYSDAAAAGITGNYVWESGLRPGALGDQGTAFGLAQWRLERRAALEAYARSQGKSPDDPGTQIQFTHRELQTSESMTGGLLRAATTPEEAARIFAAGFERPKGTDYSGREKLARSIMEGKACDESGGPGCASWLIANRTATLKTSATETWSQAVKDWDNGKGSVPSRETLNDVIDSARTSNNIDLLAKIERDTQLMDLAERIKLEPLDRQEALETELRRRIAAGETRQADVPAAMDTPGADLVLKTLQERTAAIRKGLDNDAVPTIIANNPQRLKTPEPLDPGNPQQFVQGLAMRAQIARFGAQQYGVPPLSALGSGDVQRVQAALANPDLGAKASIWGMLATLPEDVRNPTFEKLAKGDPNALAEAGAGSMMSTDPEMAKSIMAGLQIMSRNDKGILKQFEPKPGGAEGYDADLFKALPPTAYGAETRLDPSGNYAKVDQMIKARYAYLAANDPKGAEYSSARLNQAVNDVTGGTVRLNGAKTVAPAPGMPQATFDGIMQNITDRDLQGATNLNGVPLTANLLRQMGHLEAIGPGRYNVNLGGPGEKPIYAYSGWGDTPESAAPGGPRKLVLDLTGRQPAPQLMAQPIPLGGIVQGARRLIGAQGLREIRGGDQANVPGGIRG